MILLSNLPALVSRAASAATVLDVGGWYRPFNLATHVIDLGDHASRRRAEALDPEHAERFTAANWTKHDVCVTPWPFADGAFEFSVCSHLLEDVRDPLAVCRELVRVSRGGYIETPSRLREIFVKRRGLGIAIDRLCGRTPEIGFSHHRWLCEIDGTHLRFWAKDPRLVRDRRHYLTRGDIGRKLTEAESGAALFWSDSFTAEEMFCEGSEWLADFRARALATFRAGA